MTPATLPTVAAPTDRMPAGVSAIPAGSLAPDALTSNKPPRATPAGNVVARLNVPPPPTANEGGLTTQALGAAGGLGAGAVGAVGALGAGASGAGVAASGADASSSLTSQPRSKSAPTPNPKRKTVRRPASFINSTFNEGILLRTAPDPPLGTPAPRSSAYYTMMTVEGQFPHST